MNRISRFYRISAPAPAREMDEAARDKDGLALGRAGEPVRSVRHGFDGEPHGMAFLSGDRRLRMPCGDQRLRFLAGC